MAQLRHHARGLQARQAHIALISFGTPAQARAWLEETGAPFSLWLDPDRRAYRAYGLERSIVRSWGPHTLLAYVRLMASGRTWRGIQGDSNQLGGDFIVDASGVLRFIHRSADPADRPAAKTLLRALTNLPPSGGGAASER